MAVNGSLNRWLLTMLNTSVSREQTTGNETVLFHKDVDSLKYDLKSQCSFA